MINDENINEQDKDKSRPGSEPEPVVDKEISEAEDIVYTENDIVTVDNALYHTNFTPKFLATRGYKPKPKDVEIRAFIPGQIIKVFTKKGKKVKAGRKLITFEAMKMINEITLVDDIVVENVFVKAGDSVEKNQLLIKYKIRPHK